ncbi:ABC transporter ATP-binding protein [Paenibacillus hamazuiensis]|uniref:ABC transporter ATP-binding protein n=1 Tax=Paenibacillus hamazuiensis TaxID=2936508 RepID=UPI00200D906A|nr:ABC transporter ATP-binding protein [Paenibacillus hamazuiensis]
MSSAVLKVNDLTVYFDTAHGVAKAIDRLNFELQKGQIMGIVGESGCGKSLTSRAVMGLLPSVVSKVSGQIYFYGDDLLVKSEPEMRKIRGNEISMIFQEPMTSLNPVYTIGNQLTETIRLHQKVNKKEAYVKAIEMLQLVRIPSPEKRFKQFPHELSGGMRQRVMIAIALSCNPKILIADEPTTALDVTIQAEIIELMKELRNRLSMSIIMISHDLGVISEMADKVMVMYAGSAVEYADIDQIFENPLHPYTQGLINSLPTMKVKKDRLETIEGTVPNNYEMPHGCKFHARCRHSRPQCEAADPEFYDVQGGLVKCWMYTKEWNAVDN